MSDVPIALASGGKNRFTPSVPGSDRACPHGNVVADAADLVLNQGLLGSLRDTGQAVKGSILGLTDCSRRWGQGIGENLGIKGVGGAAKDTLPAITADRFVPSEEFHASSVLRKNCLVNSHGENCRISLAHLGIDRRVRPDILSAFRLEIHNFGHQYRHFTKSKEVAADGDQNTPTGSPGAEETGHTLAA